MQQLNDFQEYRNKIVEEDIIVLISHMYYGGRNYLNGQLV